MKRDKLIMIAVACLSLVLVTMPVMTAFSQKASKELICGTLSIGTASYRKTIAIAEVVKKHTDIEITVLAQTSQAAYLRLMNQGRIHLAFGDGPQLRLARLNEKPYTGNAPPLRVIFALESGLEMSQCFVTGRDTNILKISDIKGKKAAVGYAGSPSVEGGLRALLSNAGLTLADVKGVPVVTFADGMQALIEGKVDIAVANVSNYPLMLELETARGIRPVLMDDSPEAIERAKKAYPGIIITTTRRGDPRVAVFRERIPEKFNGIGYPFVLVVLKTLDDEPIYKITKCIFEHYKELAEMLSEYKEDLVWERMLNKDIFIPYHPGSVRYFQEAKIWTAELEKLQKEWIAEKPER